MVTKRFRFFILAGIVISIISCRQQPEGAIELTGMTVSRAVARLYPTEGNNITGLVTFMQTDSGIHVRAEITGLKEGPHGIHIHEYGDCSSPDGSSAGGHFNPEGMAHGAPADSVRHVGDLGNITATGDSVAIFELTDKVISFYGMHSIIGRSVVIHAGGDDLRSQPSGDSGSRMAYGVIGIAE
jgi:superoxide dismutase, Cu-Zn family